MKTVLAALFVSWLASGSRAQEPPAPSPRGLAGKVQQLLEELDGLEEGPAEAPARKRLGESIGAVVKRLQAGAEGLTLEHYVEVSSVLLEAQRTADCVRVCEAGIARHPGARALHDHLGYARLLEGVTEQTPGGRKAKLAAAEAAFRKALSLPPPSHHSHVGLFQVLSELDRPAEAIAELDLVAKDPDGKSAVPDANVKRGGLLLRAGRLKDAIAELEGERARAQDKLGARILALRARALAAGPSDLKKLGDLVDALLTDDASPAATAAAADVLFHLGRKDDAARILDQRPVADGKDDDGDAALCRQSHEALKVLARSKDLAGEPLRLALTTALDHHFLVTGKEKDADGKPKPSEFSTSPVCMSLLLKDVSGESEKTWANQILFALCLKALPGYKPPADELAFTDLLRKGDAGRFPDASFLPMVLAAMRREIADPTQAGALVALRVADKLDEPRSRPAKK